MTDSYKVQTSQLPNFRDENMKRNEEQENFFPLHSALFHLSSFLYNIYIYIYIYNIYILNALNFSLNSICRMENRRRGLGPRKIYERYRAAKRGRERV